MSIAITPILLSITPTPAFDTTRPTKLTELMQFSPLGFVGMFLLGGVFSAQFGMASVYGAQAGLSVAQISTFVSVIFIGALVTQYPIGWLSDRMERRKLIIAVAAVGASGAVIGALLGGRYEFLLVAAFIMGGASNPLYSLLLAHTNDFLEPDQMAGASGGMVFVNGLGAIAGPLITGSAMDLIGPSGFFIFCFSLFAALVLYGLYRTTRRSALSAEETGSYATVVPTGGALAVELAQELAIEEALEEESV